MLTVDNLVRTLKEGRDSVAVKLEYNETRPAKGGKKTTELGVTFRICPPGKHGAECSYTSLHFHYSEAENRVADATPVITAHFKEGRAKTANQGWDLKPYDAFALYFLICVHKPNANEFKPFRVRVTESGVDGLIRSGNIRALKSVYVSDVFDLAFWDKDAWTKMMHWVSGSG